MVQGYSQSLVTSSGSPQYTQAFWVPCQLTALQVMPSRQSPAAGYPGLVTHREGVAPHACPKGHSAFLVHQHAHQRGSELHSCSSHSVYMKSQLQAPQTRDPPLAAIHAGPKPSTHTCFLRTLPSHHMWQHLSIWHVAVVRGPPAAVLGSLPGPCSAQTAAAWRQ